MGYRSDVKIAILFGTAEDRTSFMAEASLMTADHENPDVRTLTSDFKLDYTENDDFPYQILIHYEWVKWYPDSEWVHVVNKLLETATTNHGGEYAFVRLGEDATDIEHAASANVFVGDYINVIVTSDFI